MKKFLLVPLLTLVGLIFLPNQVFAHEVYVLTAWQIEKDLGVTSINVFSALNSPANVFLFVIFALSAVISLLISFRISYSKFGSSIGHQISNYKEWTFPLIRIVFGAALLYSAHFSSLFGPELPLSFLYGGNIWSFVMYLAGILVILGLFTKFAALVLLLQFLLAILAFKIYMLTYINYLGEIVVLLLIGGEKFSLDKLLFKKSLLNFTKKSQDYIIPTLRLTFGASLLYAAIYVKFLHPALTFQVIQIYHLSKFFPFDPLFIVLGAGCVEAVIAILFILGINMRWNILFFLTWVTLSLLYFGEAVWPHLILYGISTGLFLFGYDKFSLENWLVGQFRKFSNR